MPSKATSASSELPLQGAKFCCTSISPEERVQLSEWAEEMGAEHTLDLTNDVTHLLVGDTDSQKYSYVAKEREDVKVLLPAFVAAVRELWMKDQPINFNLLERHYRCPTLLGLKISITGFEDLVFREGIAKDVIEQGGEYSGDLVKNVTHLIAKAPDGKKYQYAMTWGLKVVSLKWYQDSLLRGMHLDVSTYHPSIPPEEQGLGAWTRHSTSTPRLGKRDRMDPPEENKNRKLRRSASAKFGNQHNDVWQDMMGQHTSEASDARGLTRSKSTTALQNSLSHTSPVVEAPKSFDTPAAPPQSQRAEGGIFKNKHFAVQGFEERKMNILDKHLTGNGGLIHLTQDLVQRIPDSDSSYLIVPHEITEKQLSRLRSNYRNLPIVTESWLEYCISIRTCCPATAYPLGQPIMKINLPAVSQLVVTATGFPQMMGLHIAKCVEKLGAKYEQIFTAQTSVLVCNAQSLNRQKVEHAIAWQIPVVSEEWLHCMAQTQRLPSFEPYLLAGFPAARSEKSGSTLSTRTLQDPKQVAKLADSVHREAPATSQSSAQLDSRPLQTLEVDKNTTNVSRKSNAATLNAIVELGGSLKPPHGLLQEVSANTQGKKVDPLKPKKKLFHQFDGARSEHGDQTMVLEINELEDEVSMDLTMAKMNGEYLGSPQTGRHVQPDGVDYRSSLVADFWEVKAAAKAQSAIDTAKTTRPRTSSKKLLGRALSNLSNSSRRSHENHEVANNTKQPLSRASSINSVNTDGLGMPLSMMSRMPSDLQKNPPNLTASERGLSGNPTMNEIEVEDITVDTVKSHLQVSESAIDFHAALTALSTSQVPVSFAPTTSQIPMVLTYAESDDAAALKALLIEKRRNKARQGNKQGDPEPELSREESEETRQRLWREREATKSALGQIQDDVTIVGVGRRTRGREKALSKLLGETGSDDLLELRF